jgi:hypothetical protein
MMSENRGVQASASRRENEKDGQLAALFGVLLSVRVIAGW